MEAREIDTAAIAGAGEHVEAVSPGIKRYSLIDHDDGYGAIEVETESGEYVKFADHRMAMLNPLNTSLCKDMPALYHLLQFILDNIADLEQSPDFAGFKMQRATNDEGELLYIRLLPCDKIGDVTVTRIADVPENKVIKAAVRDTLVLVKP